MNRCKIIEMVITEKTKTGSLRPLNIRKDLSKIADLIELCFQGFLDEDGYDYIRYLRSLARETNQPYWGISGIQRTYAPLQGYVYEIDNRIIGNLSLLPFRKNGEFIYLIANVAVHPDYRRQGIARDLTSKALQHARTKLAASTWLQVREDNPPAYQLYRSMGFEERTRRSTWTYRPRSKRVAFLDDNIKLSQRRKQDWGIQKEWLENIYPETVRWNLGFHEERFKPGLISAFKRLMNGNRIRHWRICENRQLIGVVTIEKTTLFSDNLWLAAEESLESQVIQNALPFLQRVLAPTKPLTVNFPAGKAVAAFESVGFSKNHTLVWMEAPIHRPMLVEV